MKKSVLMIVSLSYVLISCITPQKCAEKFPPVSILDSTYTTPVDTVLQLEKIPVLITGTEIATIPVQVNQIPITYTDWTLVQTQQEKYLYSILEVKGDSIRARCQVDSLEAVIDSLDIRIRYDQLHTHKVEQLYNDLQAEVKADKRKTIRIICYAISLVALIILLIYLIQKFK